MITQLVETILNTFISNRKYLIILSLVGLLILIVSFKMIFPKRFWKEKNEELTEKIIEPAWLSKTLAVFNYIYVAFLVAIVGYNLFHSIPQNIKIILDPPVFNYAQINYGTIFYLNAIVLVSELILSIFILIHFFKKKQNTIKKLYTFIWIIPL